MSDQERERAEALNIALTWVPPKYRHPARIELYALLAENDQLSSKILLAWHLTDDPEVLAALAGSKEEP